MKRTSAQLLLAALVLMLMIGTQMPGAWREGVVASLEAPGSISSWAHFVLFVAIAAVALARPLSWNGVRVVMVSLGLALLTEGLQFFAIDRHPRWLDVGIDMSGAFVGMVLVVVVTKSVTYLSHNS